MPYIAPTLALIARILADGTLNDAGKSAAVHALTTPEAIRATRGDAVSDALDATLATLDAIGRRSGLSPAEWLAEVEGDLKTLTERYQNWINNPDEDTEWVEIGVNASNWDVVLAPLS